MNNILVINDLCKNYHSTLGETEAIKNLSLEVHEGEFVAIVGPSGCGKSTLLSILCNIEDKTSGEVIFPIKNKQKLGYMLQQDSLFPWLTILDNCLIGLKVKKQLTKEKKDKVIKLLDTYGLSEFKDKYPNNLSGGMRQRVG